MLRKKAEPLDLSGLDAERDVPMSIDVSEVACDLTIESLQRGLLDAEVEITVDVDTTIFVRLAELFRPRRISSETISATANREGIFEVRFPAAKL